jgi:hypothetical protein
MMLAGEGGIQEQSPQSSTTTQILGDAVPVKQTGRFALPSFGALFLD